MANLQHEINIEKATSKHDCEKIHGFVFVTCLWKLACLYPSDVASRVSTSSKCALSSLS